VTRMKARAENSTHCLVVGLPDGLIGINVKVCNRLRETETRYVSHKYIRPRPTRSNQQCVPGGILSSCYV
jgi:hypothetical protein